MAKKKPVKDTSKAAAKAAKKNKAAQKVERREKKKVGKSREEEEDDQDLESILDKMQREWEEAHRVTEELVESPPSRRANATLTPCPSGNYLWMTMWKHYIVLFGGFYDPGLKTNYLNDLWLFDTQEYKWRQVDLKDAERKPSPRSGFSFLPAPEGILLHGGYCKEYHKGSRPVGVMLDDTWFLRSLPIHHHRRMTLNEAKDGKPPAEPLTMKWERRKRPSTAFAPSLRSGCTMALWAARNTGVLFGGVTDEDTSEETLESVFHNDLYGGIFERGAREYTLDDFYSLQLDKLDRYTCLKHSGITIAAEGDDESSSDDEDDEDGDEDDEDDDECMTPSTVQGQPVSIASALEALDLQEQERLEEEEKREKVRITMRSQPNLAHGAVKETEDELRAKATEFMGVAKDATRSPEDVISTPLPGETLAMFYARSREYWAGKAHSSSDNRGKQLRRDGFGLAEERYESYKPILKEVERILAEAGLDEEEMRKGAAAGPGGSAGQSRNRR
ncbi:predicted protein [Postia placenta Mad-698-R]|nr:predicted protein [Postia placenta Mad-698-R]